MVISDLNFEVSDLKSLTAIYERVLKEQTFIDTNIFSPKIYYEGNPFSMMKVIYKIQAYTRNHQLDKNFIKTLDDHFRNYIDMLSDILFKNPDKVYITTGKHNEVWELIEKLRRDHNFLNSAMKRRGGKKTKITVLYNSLKKLELYYENKLEEILNNYTDEGNQFFDRVFFEGFYYDEYPNILEIIKNNRNYRMFKVRSDFIKEGLLKLEIRNDGFRELQPIKEELKNDDESIILPHMLYRKFVERFFGAINWNIGKKNIIGEPFYINHNEFKGSSFYEFYNFSDEEMITIALCLASSTKKPYRILTTDYGTRKLLLKSYPFIKGRYKEFTDTDLTVHFISFSFKDGKMIPQENIHTNIA